MKSSSVKSGECERGRAVGGELPKLDMAGEVRCVEDWGPAVAES